MRQFVRFVAIIALLSGALLVLSYLGLPYGHLDWAASAQVYQPIRQGPAELSGRVLDTHSLAFPSVLVQFRTPTVPPGRGRTLLTTGTDGEGLFDVLLPAGTYDVVLLGPPSQSTGATCGGPGSFYLFFVPTGPSPNPITVMAGTQNGATYRFTGCAYTAGIAAPIGGGSGQQSGQVVDALGRPFPGVLIVFHVAGPGGTLLGRVATVTTDGTGLWTAIVPAGSYRLRLLAPPGSIGATCGDPFNFAIGRGFVFPAPSAPPLMVTRGGQFSTSITFTGCTRR